MPMVKIETTYTVDARNPVEVDLKVSASAPSLDINQKHRDSSYIEQLTSPNDFTESKEVQRKLILNQDCNGSESQNFIDSTDFKFDISNIILSGATCASNSNPVVIKTDNQGGSAKIEPQISTKSSFSEQQEQKVKLESGETKPILCENDLTISSLTRVDGPSNDSAKSSNWCQECNKSFQSAVKLRQHFYTHSGESPYVCHVNQCEKSFTSRFKLKRHELIHSQAKGFHCVVCSRSFRRKDHLRNHEKIHSSIKTVHLCRQTGCNRSYNSSISYWKHQAMHSAQQGALDCKICDLVLKSQCELINHLKLHYGSRTVKGNEDKKFQCVLCEKRFFTRKDLKRHSVVHTGCREFPCMFCNHRFGRKDHMVRHAKKSHPDEYSRISGGKLTQKYTEKSPYQQEITSPIITNCLEYKNELNAISPDSTSMSTASPFFYCSSTASFSSIHAHSSSSCLLTSSSGCHESLKVETSGWSNLGSYHNSSTSQTLMPTEVLEIEPFKENHKIAKPVAMYMLSEFKQEKTETVLPSLEFMEQESESSYITSSINFCGQDLMNINCAQLCNINSENIFSLPSHMETRPSALPNLSPLTEISPVPSPPVKLDELLDIPDSPDKQSVMERSLNNYASYASSDMTSLNITKGNLELNLSNVNSTGSFIESSFHENSDQTDSNSTNSDLMSLIHSNCDNNQAGDNSQTEFVIDKNGAKNLMIQSTVKNSAYNFDADSNIVMNNKDMMQKTPNSFLFMPSNLIIGESDSFSHNKNPVLPSIHRDTALIVPDPNKSKYPSQHAAFQLDLELSTDKNTSDFIINSPNEEIENDFQTSTYPTWT